MTKAPLVCTLVAATCCAIACSATESTKGTTNGSDVSVSRISATERPLIYKIPNGQELQLSIKKTASKTYLLSLKNVSDDIVYCVCLLGDSGEVEYFPYIIESKDLASGQFIILEGGGHLAPGFSAIQPTQEIKVKFSAKGEGTYRLRFSYFTDQRVVDALRNTESPSKDPRIHSMAKSAFEVITPEMKIGR